MMAMGKGFNWSFAVPATAPQFVWRNGLVCLSVLFVLWFGSVAADEPAPDHRYLRMLEDRQWLTLPSGQGWMSSRGLYHEQWSYRDAEAGLDHDRFTGLSRRLESGIGFDTGIAQYGESSPMSSYQEYYFGLSYDALEGRMWYTGDYQGQGGSKSYYELGLRGNVSSDFSLSARLGYSDFDADLDLENYAAYVLSAQKKDLYGFGVDLQLVGSGDPRWSAAEDFRLMGTVSRSFR